MNAPRSMTAAATVAAGLMCLLVSAPAWAYLDPGSGSLLLQVLLGGLAGIAVAGKMFWWQIMGFFGIEKHHEESDTDDEPSDG